MGAFNNASDGAAETALITGQSGVGKSALVNEIHKPIVHLRGYFVSGKFDQYKRNVPYTGLLHAFGDLVQQILAESDERISLWKERLLAALGTNGQIIVDVLPNVALIIGPQQPVQTLPPAEAQNRFNLVFRDFVRVFAGADNPLVIFLDDLQWADSASRHLIRLLTTDPDSRHLLLIGAYRDENLTPAHPLSITFDAMRQEGARLNTITLGLLDRAHVNQLVADTLHCPAGQAVSLADLVYRKTNGNPFFVNQLLMRLYRDGLISFDAASATWQWDIEQIEAMHLTGDLVQLMADKLEELPQAGRRVLQLAACIGNQFDLQTLATVCEQSPEETIAALWQPLQEGLVVPLGDAYKHFYSNSGDTAGLLPQDVDISCRFLHDQVQQAAYELIPAQEQKRVRQQIGQLLLDHTPPEELEERIFIIINQLNFGRELIADPDQRRELARLNLIAGRRAKAATAYPSALEYFQTGVDLLETTSWQQHYDLTFALHFEHYECTYLNSDFTAVEELFAQLLERALTRGEKARVYNIKLIMYATQGRHRQACDVGIAGLKLFGVRLSSSPSKAAVMKELLKVRARLVGKRVPNLLHLPEMQDPDQRAVVSFLDNLTGTSYQANLNLFAVVVLKMVHTALKHGSTPMAAHGYGLYGAMLCGFLDDYEQGYQFGELGLQVAAKYGDVSAICRASFDMAAFVNHWRKPLARNLELFDTAFQAGLDSGDFYAAGYCAVNKPFQLLLSGAPLPALYEEVQKFADFVERAKYDEGKDLLSCYRQFIHCLQGKTETAGAFDEVGFDEKRHEEHLQQRENKLPLHWYYIIKIAARYLFGRSAEACEIGAAADEIGTVSAAHPYVTMHYSFYALALAQHYPQVDEKTQKSYWKTLKSKSDKLAEWARNCPENFLHLDLLVRAEMARISDHEQAAAELYEHAIQAARSSQCLHYQALASECAARFYLDLDQKDVATAHLIEARHAYQQWGASAKVEALDRAHPQLVSVAPAVAEPLQSPPTDLVVEAAGGDELDLITVIKASQTLSGEIVLGRLLEKFMDIILQNAGAQKGFLILEEKGQLVVAAEGGIDRDGVLVHQATLVEETQGLSTAIVNYVAHTREAVVLNDAAAEGIFTADRYIARHHPKSVLCTPLMHQGQFSGILYLENNLATGAFTPDRLEVLELLSAQAATSLENARLYETLEQRVAERTQELEDTHRELEDTQTQLIAELQKELETAHRMQMDLMPTECPLISGFAIAGSCKPATHVGGDFFQYFPLPRNRLAVCMADVTGHAMEAAIPVVMFSGILDNQMESDQGLDELFARLNRSLHRTLKRRTFVCFMMAEIDAERRLLKVANAGCPYPYHFCAASGAVTELQSDAYPLGVRPDTQYQMLETSLQPGDRVIFCSDGIIEAPNAAGELFGFERTTATILSACVADLSAEKILAHIVEAVHAFCGAADQEDDQTIVVIQVAAQP